MVHQQFQGALWQSNTAEYYIEEIKKEFSCFLLDYRKAFTE